MNPEYLQAWAVRILNESRGPCDEIYPDRILETAAKALKEAFRRGYNAGRAVDSKEPTFTCPVCGMTSGHPEDVRNGYCGNCHQWTGAHRGGLW